MTEDKQPGGDHRASSTANGLPLWLTVTVVLVVLGLLIYSIVVLKAEGYPISLMLGSLLGVYAGADQLLKRRDGGDGK